ncbi:hypothetical protein [Alkalibacterium kapii]|uniref:Lipoprotein n=1 Tax=Alkalibacterium kapii TaxID=426704 RepID=A0A511ARD5_9LACT|nr:hypothetical protein [Alkalibacterium kapii]GEK90760.1 hypothetical protein AKA01nite_03820 [Alkalibacterium kapii]
MPEKKKLLMCGMLSLIILAGCTNTQPDSSNNLDETSTKNNSTISDEAIEEFEEKLKDLILIIKHITLSLKK